MTLDLTIHLRFHCYPMVVIRGIYEIYVESFMSALFITTNK